MYGTLIMKRCTVIGNHGTGSIGGAGIFVEGNGSATLINSTVTGNVTNNQSGGILAWDGATVNLIHTTVSDNIANEDYATAPFGGGGIYNRISTVSIQNSIVAGNIDMTNPATAAHAKWPDVYGEITSLGGNLIGDSSDSTGWLGNDLVGTAEEPIDAGLGTLDIYPPGHTPLYPLLAESPAIDAAPCIAEVTYDQRGTTRPRGKACDSGAYEFESDYLIFLPLIQR